MVEEQLGIVMDALVGNLGRDPELKFSQNGVAVAKFSLAVTERVNEGGTWKDGSTTWYTVVCFRGLAEGVTETLRKGDRVVVAGTVSQRSYTREDGVEAFTLEVQASEVGKGLSRFKGLQRTGQPTGMASLKDIVDSVGGTIIDDAPPF